MKRRTARLVEWGTATWRLRRAYKTLMLSQRRQLLDGVRPIRSASTRVAWPGAFFSLTNADVDRAIRAVTIGLPG